MRILIVGGGGREHALAWALGRSPQRPEVLVAPGNAGTDVVARNVPVPATDLDGIGRLVEEEDVALTIIGPEAPLVAGLADRLRQAGRAVVGPSAAAARLEGSKAFAKSFMQRHGIPTAAHRTFQAEDYDAARAYLDEVGAPVVVKASGLAAGKGAFVCATPAEAGDALDAVVRARAFGAAGGEVVIEAFMEGDEVSVFALTDGTDYVLLAPAQDHKRVGEGDTGPNTGGMGAYAPAPVLSDEQLGEVRRRIIEPTLDGMRSEGAPYQGVLYAGLMLTADGPQVVEFNCRLGDPEAQVVLPLLETDAVELFQAVAEGRLGEVEVSTRDGAAACVVLASGGYPGLYQKGFEITGLEAAEAVEGVTVFHAGTRRDDAGQTLTAGGRVLGVTGLGADLAEALERAYRAADLVAFDGKQLRRDIGRRGLEGFEGARV